MKHRLQLFDTPESLAESVSSFLFEGYVAGEHLMIVAKPQHRDAVLAALQKMGCPAPSLEPPQQFIALDASEMLRSITRDGRLDAGLFNRTVSPVVKALADSGPLRIYGEMVELLAEEADLGGAMALERLWNVLAHDIPMTTLCGYSSAHFTGSAGRRSLRDICGTHTDVTAEADDWLGRYLLTTA